MIAKGKAIAHGGNALNYAMREGKLDKVVGRNMVDGDDPADILREFEMVNQHNYRCKNKYLRFEIGIAPQDRGKLAPEDMTRSSFQIIANTIPEYPFDAYYVGEESMPSVDELLENDDLEAKYKRLRKIIVLFRSHSKGRLAKYQDKIENQRVAGLGVGKKVLEKLVQSGVLYLEGNLYFINPDKIGSQLGVSYYDVRFGQINEKTIEFLKTIG